MFPTQKDPTGGIRDQKSAEQVRTNAITDPSTWTDSEIRLWLERVSLHCKELSLKEINLTPFVCYARGDCSLAEKLERGTAAKGSCEPKTTAKELKAESICRLPSAQEGLTGRMTFACQIRAFIPLS